jgi:hypothetical protein
MKKIRLRVETLAVETFETSRAEDVIGTVEGHMPPPTPLRSCDPAVWTCNRLQGTCDTCAQQTAFTYCGSPCSNTAAQDYTCASGCVWP